MSLTDIAVKKAKVTEKPYRLKDSGGMFLFVTPAGGKLWRGNTASTRSKSS